MYSSLQRKVGRTLIDYGMTETVPAVEMTIQPTR